MTDFYKLRGMLCDEVDEIARKGELGDSDLDILHKLTATIKNIDKIEMYEESDYSRGGDWDASIRGTYGRGSSYTNRGKHYVRGHYSRDEANMKARLDDMIRETDDDRVKEALRRAMSMVEG